VKMNFNIALAILALISLSTVTTETCNKADVVFLLDESSSIQPIPLSQIKQFVFDVMDGVNVGPGKDHSHVAVIMFSDMAQFLFRFNILESISLNRTKGLLRNRPQRGGRTQTFRGLELIKRVAFSKSYGARNASDVAKIAIVLTDGNSQLPNKTKEVAGKIRSETNIHVFAIGVGNETMIRQSELEAIATDKASVYRVADAAGLSKIKGTISGAACRVVPPPAEEDEDYQWVPTEGTPEEDEDYQWVPTEGTPEEYASDEGATIVET